MKKTKRLAALMLAVVMVFALGSTALADDIDTATGLDSTTDETLVIKKALVVTNELGASAEGLQVAYPAVSFTYSVAPIGDENLNNAYVQDASGTKVTVRSGPAGGVQIGDATSHNTIGNVSLATGKVTLNKNGQEAVQGNLNLWIDVTAFSSPGIYRYVITDTTPAATLTAAGVARNDSYDDTYYLDIYIQKQELKPVYVDKDDPSKTTTDPNQAADDSTSSDGKMHAIDSDTGDPITEPADYTHPNHLEVGGKVLTTDPQNAITGGDGGNANTVKQSGIDTLPLVDETSTADETIVNTDPNSPNTGVPVYEKEGGGTTTDPNEAKKDENNNPIPATDPTTGDPLYQHTIPTGTKTTKLDPDATVDLAANDVYNTYNVDVAKTVSGAMAETTHEFQFTAVVNNMGLAYTVKDGDETTFPAYTNSAAYTEGLSRTGFTMNDGETSTILGLSANAAIGYVETNNTQSNYKVTAKNATPEDITVTYSSTVDTDKLAPNGTATVYATPVAIWATTNNNSQGTKTFEVTKSGTTGKYATEAGSKVATMATTTFNNDLTEISPTGIALRYAPYIFMLAAAAVFVVLSRKERDTENA